VGRHICGHAHGNARGPVDQQCRKFCREYRGFFQGFIIVGDEFYGLFFKIGQHLVRELAHTDFRITHGRRRVAVHGAEIALAVHQGITQGEVLGHADNGVIHGSVPVGVVFTNNITHDTGRFFIGFIPVIMQLLHGV